MGRYFCLMLDVDLGWLGNGEGQGMLFCLEYDLF